MTGEEELAVVRIQQPRMERSELGDEKLTGLLILTGKLAASPFYYPLIVFLVFRLRISFPSWHCLACLKNLAFELVKITLGSNCRALTGLIYKQTGVAS